MSEIFESYNYRNFLSENSNFLSFAYVLTKIIGEYSVSFHAFKAGFPLYCLILISGPSLAKSTVFCPIFPQFLCVICLHAFQFLMLCVAVSHIHWKRTTWSTDWCVMATAGSGLLCLMAVRGSITFFGEVTGGLCLCFDVVYIESTAQAGRVRTTWLTGWRAVATGRLDVSHLMAAGGSIALPFWYPIIGRE